MGVRCIFEMVYSNAWTKQPLRYDTFDGFPID